MKKILVVVLVMCMLLSMCACGNMSLGLGNFEFKKIHVDTYHYSGCFTVEKWYDYEMGIEVKTKEAGSMYLSEGQYILLDGDKDCPFCKAAEETTIDNNQVDIEDIDKNAVG